MNVYRDTDTGDIIEAYQIPEGCSVVFVNPDGDKEKAEAGDYLICHPYNERVDEESFLRDYERVT